MSIHFIAAILVSAGKGIRQNPPVNRAQAVRMRGKTLGALLEVRHPDRESLSTRKTWPICRVFSMDVYCPGPGPFFLSCRRLKT